MQVSDQCCIIHTCTQNSVRMLCHIIFNSNDGDMKKWWQWWRFYLSTRNLYVFFYFRIVQAVRRDIHTRSLIAQINAKHSALRCSLTNFDPQSIHKCLSFRRIFVCWMLFQACLRRFNYHIRQKAEENKKNTFLIQFSYCIEFDDYFCVRILNWYELWTFQAPIYLATWPMPRADLSTIPIERSMYRHELKRRFAIKLHISNVYRFVVHIVHCSCTFFSFLFIVKYTN